ncbi:A/G-specific DNA-adenine glycosylase [Selenomonas ruminantium]|uniref:Adenine DNA glycosylase n=1 Tax=Selenomonas ruminantium TaxID=971 RepID=A0A1M6X1A6_SELRU|nr:A/G-specific adenine glycosylase [Selenomonas ruminantium]SHK99787.1 A/G-specific DNA-adenine glycosylase [Selenomonas ruminantium]
MRHTIDIPHTELIPDLLAILPDWYRRQADERELPWRSCPAPYHTWLSEIMLQQTRASAVIPYYERFLASLPDIESLAACDDDQLMKLWQGLGYYSRARNLKKAAIIICQEYSGQLPQDFTTLLSLPGIGRYTASAIGSIAFGQPWPAVDGNVLRVLSRVLASAADIAAPATKKALENALAPHYPSGTIAGELNQAFMDLGATICLPHGLPHCSCCPLARICLAHAEGLELELPRKSSTRQRRQEKHTVLLLRQGNAIALHQRETKGLLAGLWEFPNLPGKLTKKEVVDWLKENGLTVESIQALPPAKHIFSHIEWQLSGWLIKLPAADTLTIQENHLPFVWASSQQIAERFSLPSAFQYYFPYIQTK